MSLCKIDNMDVVSYTSTVLSIVVISEYSKAYKFAYSNLCNIR